MGCIRGPAPPDFSDYNVLMSTHTRLLTASAALVMPVILAGCPGDFDGGYEKVAFRQSGNVTMAAAPNPPPVIAGFGAAGAAEVPTLAADAPAGVTQEMVDSGAQLFGTVCTACHGPGGAGTPAGPTLSDATWINIGGSYDEIVGVIQSGVANPQEHPGAMPPLGGGNFNADEVRELGAYVFALSRAPA